MFANTKSYQPNNNTIVINHPNGESALYNYGTLVAISKQGRPFAVTDAWDQSRTTMKRVFNFFEQSASDTRSQLARGELILLP